MLTALVAIAPMAILLVHLFFVWMVSTNRGGWHQDLPVPYSIIPTMGPIMPMVIPIYWTKGPFVQMAIVAIATAAILLVHLFLVLVWMNQGRRH
jgi:hypothetical protein